MEGVGVVNWTRDYGSTHATREHPFVSLARRRCVSENPVAHVNPLRVAKLRRVIGAYG